MGGAKQTENGQTPAGASATPGAGDNQPGSATRGKVSPDERWRMIAEAAYYRARARGFHGASPGEDWRAAEAEVDRRLAGEREPDAQAASRDDEQAAYRRLRDEVQQRLAAIKGSVDAKAIQDALERATVQVKRAGGYAGTTVSRAADRLKKDMSQAAAAIGPRWQAFSGKTAGVFSVWRDRSAEFLARAATGVADWLNRSARRSPSPELQAGTVVGPGSFQCTRCKGVVRMESPGPLPACPTCQHTGFRQSA